MINSGRSWHKETEYLPMTQGQMWLRDEMLKMQYPGWASIEFLVKTKMAMNESTLQKCVSLLLEKFENLRVRISKRNGKWVQQLYALEEADAFGFYDLSQTPSSERLFRLKEICMSTREWLSPETGNLIKIFFFKFSESEGRIWFYMHHLISDFVSALIVAADLMTSYKSLTQKGEVKSQSVKDYRKWMYIMEGYSRDVVFPTEVEYWLALPWSKAKLLPSDYPEKFENDAAVTSAIHNKKLISSYRNETCSLPNEDTFILFNKYGSDFETLLIAAFFVAMVRQMKVNCLDISVSYSGRNALPGSYEVSEAKVVGFLSGVRVLLLRNPGMDNIVKNIHDVMSQIRNVPNKGIGFSLIDLLVKKNKSLKNEFGSLRKNPQILFNYLGKANTTINNDQYELVTEDTGRNDYPEEIKNSILECIASINQGQLNITLAYIKEYHRPETAKALLAEFISLLRHCALAKINDNAENGAAIQRNHQPV